ncbi:MAG TPA: HlyD family type I secretion periplasmic adaptor subunit [Stellaceae bacterium]|nr:HlyD family type I secretion periplasmic adaptor subunit [Stellaceae bacterium]
MKSGKAIVPQAAGGVPAIRELRSKDELAFLPAALEIVETPPSPLGRWISITIMALFCFALAWASLGQVDIVVSSTGKIVPSGRTKVVQPFETGIVRAIHVQDGSRVTAGEVLVELDPTLGNADREHYASDLMASRVDIARLKASVAPGDDPLAAFAPPSDAPPAMLATARQLLLNQDAEQRAKVATLDRQQMQKAAERDSFAATVAKLQATVPILQQRVDIRKYLADKEYGSKLTYLETLTDLVQQQKELPVDEGHLRAAEAELQAIAQTRDATVSEYRSARLAELATAEQKASGLAQDLVKADERTRLQILTAPVDGTVQQLAVHTVGGVVTPAQPLLEVVPLDSRLEIEAMVSNHDVGFVHAGQDAEIKVDTFNFTKYGLLHGTVLGVSADAIPTNSATGGAAAGKAPGADTQSQQPGQDLLYAARVSLDQTQMDIDGEPVKLSPGMAVTVEIKTGSRRVISYLLSPLMRFRQESLRER